MNEQSADLMRATRGPIILITVGILFAIDRFTVYRFSETWPVLLIVWGVLHLLCGSRRDRRGGYGPPPAQSMPPPPPPHDHGGQP